MKRGLVLTIDGLIALTMLLTAYSLLLAYGEHSPSDYRLVSHSLYARDYLEAKYRLRLTFSDADFLGNTTFNINESLPATGEWLGGVIYQYPQLNACANQAACSFANNSAAASYFNAQDASGLLHRAWVST